MAQEQAPQALRPRENQELLSAIVNQTAVGVPLTDVEGHFKFAGHGLFYYYLYSIGLAGKVVFKHKIVRHEFMAHAISA